MDGGADGVAAEGSESGGAAAESSGGVGKRTAKRGSGGKGSGKAKTAGGVFKELMKQAFEITCKGKKGVTTLDASAFIDWRARCIIDPSSMFAEWVKEPDEQPWF